mgnify:CR=1 FL=1
MIIHVLGSLFQDIVFPVEIIDLRKLVSIFSLNVIKYVPKYWQSILWNLYEIIYI